MFFVAALLKTPLKQALTVKMIDRENRDILARQLKLLATGKITNDEFEDSIKGC